VLKFKKGVRRKVNKGVIINGERRTEYGVKFNKGVLIYYYLDSLLGPMTAKVFRAPKEF
jgi:hypothetical protein